MAASGAGLTKLVPGFEFLQGLVKNAGAALPNVGQWIAPTLDPAELDKRIEELRTVQFWLEQNARMLATTIQALEVQRMTLSTLKTMNVSVSELGDAMKLRTPSPSPQPSSGRGDKAAAPSGVVDPMQWWGALTQQFAQLAVQAMKDSTTDAAKQLAGAVAKQSLDTAGKTLKRAAGVPAAVARGARDAVQGAAPKPARRRVAKPPA
ncbi:MAG TPA: PhaM family polyhydroxyalkanoate granule multifunctional regulatory protein [Burkholderiaceae bacterium]|nr:PhaM family polyhydroxyalkanoate granule multifunctional regulatory protein [Burkholderiaceae bacterium]HSB98810.1 PhaM family polyhydroxyalkanoate granule multifunctional regulatory protein [Burkholderiaceae bacterium]